MRSFYAQFWPWQSSASLRKAIVVSLVLHVVLVVGLTVRFPTRLQLTQAGSYTVDLINPSAPLSDTPPLGTPTAKPPAEPTPPTPPPPPKREEPKPKAPEPVQEKEKPKPRREPVKEPEKPEEETPKKEKPNPEPVKKDEKKTKKKEPVKVAKNDPKPRPISDNPLEDMVPETGSAQSTRPTRQPAQPAAGIPTGKPGLSMAGGIPSALGAWGANVQRKVEQNWQIPQGIQLGPVDDGAVISFWVSRDGQLLGDPVVVKHAVDPEVAASAIRAIRAAVPFPFLPESYGDAQVQVFYTFIPTR